MNPLRHGERVWLTEAAAETIVECAARAHPHETGGVLVGVLVGDRPWITLAVEVASAESRRSYYELPEGARHRVVTRLRRGDQRVGYLGDWHSHPEDVGASPVDVKAVLHVAQDWHASSPHPVLIVARRVESRYALDAEQVDDSQLLKVRMIAAGPLPTTGDNGTSER